MIGAAKKKWAAHKRKKRLAALGELELPSFPEPTMRALRMLRDPNTAVAQVGQILASDPKCSVKMLGMVNAASNGLPKRVDNVPHAAALLGRQQLESILLSASVASVVPGPRTQNFDPERFWRAAARRALMARALAERVDRANTWTSYTAGLLQDVALPLLVAARGEPYDAVLGQWQAQGGSLTVIEREVFDFDHAEIGRDLAEAWALPDGLREGIAVHHEHIAPDYPAVRLVSALGEAETDPSEAERLVELSREAFNVPADDTVAMLAAAFEGADDLARCLTS